MAVVAIPRDRILTKLGIPQLRVSPLPPSPVETATSMQKHALLRAIQLVTQADGATVEEPPLKEIGITGQG